MIDLQARNRLLQRKTQQDNMAGVFNAMGEAIDLKKENKEIIDIVKAQTDKNTALLEKMAQAIPMIYKVIPRSIPLPKIFNIKGSVKVENQISNAEMEKKLDNVSTQIRLLAQAISNIPQQKIEFPKIDIPKPEKIDIEPLRQAILALQTQSKMPEIKFPDVKMPKAEKIDFSPITEAIENLHEALGSVPKDESLPILRNIQNSIQALVERPVMTPQPVTNININALQGTIKTTSATVGTTVTSLPTYGQLFNRRALVIYNNSSNTIYYGGSDVTTSNGMPIPASSYSPILDAGYNMIVYAIASTSNNNVRVMEVAARSEGGVAIQE